MMKYSVKFIKMHHTIIVLIYYQDYNHNLKMRIVGKIFLIFWW